MNGVLMVPTISVLPSSDGLVRAMSPASPV